MPNHANVFCNMAVSVVNVCALTKKWFKCCKSLVYKLRDYLFCEEGQDLEESLALVTDSLP